jgi:hypothetical protein
VYTDTVLAANVPAPFVVDGVHCAGECTRSPTLPQCTLTLLTDEVRNTGFITTQIISSSGAPDNSTRLARRLDAAAADPLVGVHSAPPKTAVSADGAGKCTLTLSGPAAPLLPQCTLTMFSQVEKLALHAALVYRGF